MLLFNIDDRRFALGLELVENVVESEKIYLLPSGRKPVIGAISNRGEAICVVSLRDLFALEGDTAAPYRIVIVKEGDRILGLCARGSEIILMHNRGEESLSIEPTGSKYTSGIVELVNKKYEMLDFETIYNDISKQLAKRF